MRRTSLILMLVLVLTACSPAANANQLAPAPTRAVPVQLPTSTGTIPPPATAAATAAPAATPFAEVKIPNFDHIVLIVLENKDYQDVVGSSRMPYLNSLAEQNVLLTNYFAVTHPSLPNYIALVSGSTQNITSDCKDCFVNAPNLADHIEASGRSWKAYQEDMPSPCFVGDAGLYVQKHNPLVYFDSVRLDEARCMRSIVPLTRLKDDLVANQLPDFAFIMPNMCNSGHDCSRTIVDQWLKDMINTLQQSAALGANSLIVITYDEAGKEDTGSCCNLDASAGGQIATVLLSPLARTAFADATPYSHYSLLKTILAAWNLPPLGKTAEEDTGVIAAPWVGESAGNNQSPVLQTAAVGNELTFPIRAAFYYPWFPEAWKQSGMDPFTRYRPSPGYYSLDDPAVITRQIEAMQYGKIEAGIASWWGRGTASDQRVPVLLQEAEKANFFWTLYVESEGIGDPGVETIKADLEYIRDTYEDSPAFLKIDHRPVIFVYADANDGCAMTQRWQQGNTINAYLVMKVFSGYRDCPAQPDAWHQYAPDTAQKLVGKHSISISPGFWKADEAAARLPRDLNQWNQAIREMVNSNTKFHLITTFNEWGEGSAVESAFGWESASGYGQYLDALHLDGLGTDGD